MGLSLPDSMLYEFGNGLRLFRHFRQKAIHDLGRGDHALISLAEDPIPLSGNPPVDTIADGTWNDLQRAQPFGRSLEAGESIQHSV